MSVIHFVRVGLFGHVGRFRSVDGAQYARASQVICRTDRGLELGEVLAHEQSAPAQQSDGTLLRGVTEQDQWVLKRLQKHRDAAFQACAQMLSEQEVDAVLMDVEHLFDGQSLFFYFLGDVPKELEDLTSQLAELYETKVQFRKFAETVEQGCGPGCGTEGVAGQCGTDGGCASCGISSACRQPAEGS